MEKQEQEIHDFVNQFGFQLKLSNDTMEAVRLLRKELPKFMDKSRQQLLKEVLGEMPKEKGQYDNTMIGYPYGWNDCLDTIEKIIKKKI